MNLQIFGSFFVQNVNHLLGRKKDIYRLSRNKSLFGFGLCETRLNGENIAEFISRKEFGVYRCDENELNQHGGTLVAIKKELNPTFYLSGASKNIDCVWAKFEYNNTNYYFASSYNNVRDRDNTENFIKFMSEAVNTIYENDPLAVVLVYGDFNIRMKYVPHENYANPDLNGMPCMKSKHPKWFCLEDFYLKTNMRQLNLNHYITPVTKEHVVIDVIFTNHPGLFHADVYSGAQVLNTERHHSPLTIGLIKCEHQNGSFVSNII